MPANLVASARSVSLSSRRESGGVGPALWLRRLRSRRILAALDQHQIREAGLDPFVVREEILKPFWRA